MHAPVAVRERSCRTLPAPFTDLGHPLRLDRHPAYVDSVADQAATLLRAIAETVDPHAVPA
jgi:hypothetical protein